MKRLVVVTCVVLLLLKLKGFDCDNVTLLISPSKYTSTFNKSSYCGLSPSEIASLSAMNPIPYSPFTPIKVSVVKAILTSPYILSSLSPPVVFNFLGGVSSTPSLLQSIEPSTVASLVRTLCASPSLLKAAPCNTVVDFINAITISPKIISALPPSILVGMLSKLYAETPSVLYGLLPPVRVALIHTILSPKMLSTLKPTEIIFVIDFLVSFEYALAELPPSDIIELLQTIASSPNILNNIPTSQIINFLYRVSKLAPFLFDSIPADVINTLLTPIISVRCQSPTTLVNLASFLSSSPHILNAIDPAIVSFLLTALSPPGVLCAVPPVLLVKLLAEISFSNTLIKTIEPEALIGLLHSIKSTSPITMCDIPPSVRSTFVIHLTAAEVAGALPIETSVELIDTLIDNPCFLAGLSLSSIHQILKLMTSVETILGSIPLKKIVRFIHDVSVSSPFVLRETPADEIRKLLSPLTSISSLSSLDPCCFEKLLSTVSNCPFLLNVLSLEQLANILTTLNSSPGNIKEVPTGVYVDILTRIFTSPELLPNVPLALLLNSLTKIENHSPNVLSSIPSSAVTAFMDFLGDDPDALASLSAPDIGRLLSMLTKTPSFLTRVSVKTLSALLALVAECSAVLYNIPAGTKIDLFHRVHSVLPSMLCSLPPRPLRDITHSFGSFETLSALSADRLVQLTTMVSECPCLLTVFDPALVVNLLDALSASPCALGVLSPRVVVDLVTAISSDDALAASVPASSWARFLRAQSTAAPRTLSRIPASAYAAALKPLESADGVDDLTAADFEDLLDTLIEVPGLWAALPRPVTVNLMAALSRTFTAVSRAKTVVLLVSAHTVSPALVHAVPAAALTGLLDTFVTAADLSALPPEFVAGLMEVLSRSSYLMDAMSASAFDALLGLLSASPRTLSQVPPDALERFLAQLSLRPPAVLERVKPPLLVSLLSATLSGSTVVPPAVVRALLASLGDARTVHDLEPTDVASLIDAATCTPRILDAITGTPLDLLLIKAASSPRLLSFASPSLMTSFLTTLASSPIALDSVRPSTLVDVLATLAASRPAVLSALPPRVATALLATLGTRPALATLPPPAINSLTCLLLAFPNLFAALPLNALAALLDHLSATPAVLGALPSCTLARLLAALSSLPPLLRALPPGVLTSFLSTLSLVAPAFLRALPPPVVATLFAAVASDPAALASATPASVASLIATLNRSPGLVLALPAPVLIAFFTYLSSRPGLLKDTTRSDLLKVIDSVRSPHPVPRVAFNGPPCAFGRFDGNFVSFLSLNSRALADAGSYDFDKDGTSNGPKLGCCLAGLPTPSKCTVIYPLLPPADSDKNKLEMPIDLMPKLAVPENSKGATVYVYKKDEKPPTDEKTTTS